MATSTDQGFSILIPTWNNLDYLQCCIESLRRNSAFRHQIIVHINEGTDGTLDWVASQTDLDYTHSDVNIGICYAMNGARPLVKRDYIAYFNDDMYALPGWDTALVAVINQLQDNQFFLSATMIEHTDTGNPCVIVADYGRTPNDFKVQDIIANYMSHPKQDWYGATWPPNVVHRDNWDMVGGYSLEFSPGMYSDPDFAIKLWQSGVRVFRGVADSRVYHFGSRTINRVALNPGKQTFVLKWGISSRVFTAKFLRRGEVATTLELPIPRISRSLIDRLKRAWVAFRN